MVPKAYKARAEELRFWPAHTCQLVARSQFVCSTDKGMATLEGLLVAIWSLDYYLDGECLGPKIYNSIYNSSASLARTVKMSYTAC